MRSGRAPADRFDLVVVGSGAAGLMAALEAVTAGASVVVVTKDDLGESTSELAQGGIAAVLEEAVEDSTEAHLDDTLMAGAGLCDEEAVRVLVESAPAAVAALEKLGAVFDREPGGRLALSREGGHRGARVVHAGGAATGAEVVRALRARTQRSRVEMLEGVTVTDLVVERGRCVGIGYLDATGARAELRAGAVVLATGGAGQCFAVTTNPLGSTGDGIAMALLAGVAVADLEFVQFHPTALVTAAAPRPLLSEALRGEGAVLNDALGRRFIDELQPRDVVSRAIAERLELEGTDHVFLDARGLARFDEHFPSLARILSSAGLSAERDLLPVAPAAHYLCGGVLTDLDGRTSLEGLFAIGEVACTGVHGANRLASNSLLEGLVFARRCVAAIVAPAPWGGAGARDAGASRTGALALEPVRVDVSVGSAVCDPAVTAAARARLQQVMSEGAGVRRSAQSLEAVRSQLRELASLHGGTRRDREAVELSNLVVVALAIVEAATRRLESRGAHTRVDFPDRDDRRFRVRLSPRLSLKERDDAY